MNIKYKLVLGPARGLMALIFTFFTSLSVMAQDDEDLQQFILKQDSLFWQAYNTCDVEGMKSFLAEDLEFYHDRNGLTSSLSGFEALVKSGLCSDESTGLRREAKPGTVKVYPLPNFGAIISGAHVFYRYRKGQDEYAEEAALFTHVWRRQEGAWKMSRVLSYDHQSVPYENQRQSIALSAALRASYAGTYQGAQTGKVEISVVEEGLKLKATQFEFTMYAQKEGSFFIKERNIQFDFVKDEQGQVVKMVVRDKGVVAEELEKQ